MKTTSSKPIQGSPTSKRFLKYPLCLASASPRRRELLEKAGFSFMVHPSQISEKLEKNLTLDDQILEIARQKARATELEIGKPGNLFLGADTLVIHEGLVLGKPSSPSEAHEFLRRLSGSTHEVKTGLALCLSAAPLILRQEICHIETSRVRFRDLSDSEIQDYVASGDPMDKAGAYGIQGKGGEFIASLEGSFTNVMGLPMEALIQIFEKQGWFTP